MISPDVLGCFLMQEHFELFTVFHYFCIEIHSQFGQTIRILRNNNSKYFSAYFNFFMASHGIVDQ